MIQFIVPLGQTLGQTGAGPHAFIQFQAQVEAPKEIKLGKNSGTNSPHDNF